MKFPEQETNSAFFRKVLGIHAGYTGPAGAEASLGVRYPIFYMLPKGTFSLIIIFK